MPPLVLFLPRCHVNPVAMPKQEDKIQTLVFKTLTLVISEIVLYKKCIDGSLIPFPSKHFEDIRSVRMKDDKLWSVTQSLYLTQQVGNVLQSPAQGAW